MSGILSVRDRIAMMNTSKPTPKPVPEPTSSFENPVRKAGSIADKIAALKESSEKQDKEKPPTQSPITPNQPATNSPSNNINADCSSMESSQGQSQPPERRLSIKDRIAAMKSGGNVPIVAPAPTSRPVSRPVSISMHKTSTEESVPPENMVCKEDIPKKVSSEIESPNATAIQDTNAANEDPTILKEEKKVESDLAVTTESVSTPSESDNCSSERSENVNIPAPGTITTSPPPVAATSDTSSESTGPKVNSIAAKIAALKNQQKAEEPAGPPVVEVKERRRLSTDLKGLGAKINIGGLMPGAPRPIFPSRPPPPTDETNEKNQNGSTSKNSAVDENGELKHLSLSRPSVNSVSRKRAVKSVKLSSTWKDELTGDDLEILMKSSESEATTGEDAT